MTDLAETPPSTDDQGPVVPILEDEEPIPLSERARAFIEETAELVVDLPD